MLIPLIFHLIDLHLSCFKAFTDQFIGLALIKLVSDPASQYRASGFPPHILLFFLIIAFI